MGRNITFKSLFLFLLGILGLISVIFTIVYLFRHPFLIYLIGAGLSIYVLWGIKKYGPGFVPFINKHVQDMMKNVSLCPLCGDIASKIADKRFGSIFRCIKCGAIGVECETCHTLNFIDRIKENASYFCSKCNKILIEENPSEKSQDNLSLLKYGKDLIEEARFSKIRIFGREKEIENVIEVLVRTEKNNPLLVGEAGVGKTAIVKGLAQRIVEGNVPDFLKNKRIIELDITSLVAGTIYRGDFEKRIKSILDEVKKSPNVIVFIDEIHTIIGAGSPGGGVLDLANILKPSLAKGEFRCIGATTCEEYERYIKKDPALERRFNVIRVNELSREDTEELLKYLKGVYERHYKVKIDERIIDEIIDLSATYLINRRFPDKAKDVLERSCAKSLVKNLKKVTPEVVEEVVEEMCGIPVRALRDDREVRKIVDMEKLIESEIFGQEEAVKEVVEVIKRLKTGLASTTRPYGVFLFYGPTGVGKTELAKIMAFILFGSKDKLISLNMSEYSEENSVSRLIGAPPGYIGFEEEGVLTRFLKQQPFSVVLLDEIEKAHPKVFALFLRVFDEGFIQDNKGRTVDARNAIFVMTSNLKEEDIKVVFRPEFLNRIDRIIKFKQLDIEAVKCITKKILREFKERPILKRKNIEITYDEGTIEFLSRNGFNETEGARSLRRYLEKTILSPLGEMLLRGEIKEGDRISIYCEDNSIKFKIAKGKKMKEEGKETLKEEQKPEHIQEEAGEKKKKRLMRTIEIHKREIFKKYGVILSIDSEVIETLLKEKDIDESFKTLVKLPLETKISTMRGKIKTGDIIRIGMKEGGTIGFYRKV